MSTHHGCKLRIHGWLRLAALAVLALGILATQAEAAEPKAGAIVEVTCKAQPDQKYSCYLPKGYTAKKAWPILYCWAPNAAGNAFTQRYRKVCEERGWIVVGSMNSKNGPWEPIQAAINAMWADTEARFKLSPKRRYASGFSGGSRVSFALAEEKSDFFAGIIGIGAGLSSNSRGLPKQSQAVWIMCGETDFNLRELNQLSEKLKTNGNPLVYRNFPGAHTMPPPAMMTEAVRWMDDQSESRREETLQKETAAAAELAGAGDPQGAWVKLLRALQKIEGGGKARTAAEKLKKSLERIPEVKPEVKALAKFEKAIAWIEKNQGRMEKSTSAKAQGVKKLEEVVEKYPGTHAAKLAEGKLAELE
jgi:dienelactone hydrolase